jgi:DNA-binding CsgD family transcriptional regulator
VEWRVWCTTERMLSASSALKVLQMIARGLQSREIGQRLHITPKTVGHHIGHIYMKIGGSNRVAASLFATEHGLLGL